MLDIGWSELAVVAVLALLIIGPKDLPAVMRTIGKWTQKARSVSREFQSSVDEMVREAELEDARKALDSAKNLNVQNAIENTIDPTGEVKESARELDREARREEPGDGKGAAESTAGDTPAAAETAESEGGAKVIKHPVKIAPPHSITPPAEEPAAPAPAAPEPAASEPASAQPAAEAPAGEKSASGGGAA